MKVFVGSEDVHDNFSSKMYFKVVVKIWRRYTNSEDTHTHVLLYIFTTTSEICHAISEYSIVVILVT